MAPVKVCTVGILGGGQLGLMIAHAGIPLGIRSIVMDPSADPPAASVAEHLRADFTSRTHLDKLAARADIVTYELEGVPLESARYLAASLSLRPPFPALEASQDRWREKQLFGAAQIATAPWMRIESEDDLPVAAAKFGYPFLLKKRRGGYDGRGQTLIQNERDLCIAWGDATHDSYIAEGLVQFDRELSLVAVRDATGNLLTYPLVENIHHDGILRITRAPAPRLDRDVQEQATAHARRIMDQLDYVGICTIEFFESGGRLIANEIAPRVHNSGHWTIEGAITSQFENHLRAIFDLPLGSTEIAGPVAMINLIGELPNARSILSIPGAALHVYGKIARPNRKLGHVTLRGHTPEDVEAGVRSLRSLYPLAPAQPNVSTEQ